jgi:uncharacterized protein YndB with AHSA1/START domain
MNIVIIILLVIAGLIALLLVVALFVKKEYAVERQITISKPRQSVFDYVKHLKNQDNYNKWVMMDPNARRSFKGTDATVGFVSAWDSDKKNVGKGEQEIKRIKEGERIDLEIRFEKPFKGISPVYMITETVSDNSSKVRWGFAGKMAYPMNVMLLFVNFPELLGKDLETSLTSLKTQLEKNN